MEIKVFLEKKVSAKSGKEYFNLYVDYGYRKQQITMDPALICSLCDVNFTFLYEDLKVDEPAEVCTVIPTE